MSIQDPKAKGKHEPTSHTTGKENKGQQPAPTLAQKSRAFDEGLQNNSNTQTGTANSGYDEKNPKKPGGKQQIDPKVTNQDNDITNTGKNEQWDEEPVDEQAKGNSRQRTDPEIDSPVPDTEKNRKEDPEYERGIRIQIFLAADVDLVV